MEIHNTVDIIASAGAVTIKPIGKDAIALTPALAKALGNELKRYSKIAVILINELEEQRNGSNRKRFDA